MIEQRLMKEEREKVEREGNGKILMRRIGGGLENLYRKKINE